MSTVSTSRARRAWDDFEGSLRKSLSKAIALGKELLDLKEKCAHGEFGRYFSDHEDKAEGALPFTRKWAHRIMTIAESDAIQHVHQDGHLPPDLNTVYELATMTAPALEAAIEAGKVTPNTTRAEAKAIKREAGGGATPGCQPSPARSRHQVPAGRVAAVGAAAKRGKGACDSPHKRPSAGPANEPQQLPRPCPCTTNGAARLLLLVVGA